MLYSPTMFDTYQDIFKLRADSYHAAMAEFPVARQQEFEHAVQFLDLEPEHRLCDVPSGGGYLADFVSTDRIHFQFLETSSQFAAHCPRSPYHQVAECELEAALPLPDASMDRILSLAALHHVDDKKGICREFARVLRNGGKLVVADVEEGSGAARFLNEFVDRFNSMGHCGLFLNADNIQDIDDCGLQVSAVVRPPLHWSFSSREEMVRFCKHLFGLDLASSEDVLAGIGDYLSLTESRGYCAMSWQLTYVTAEAR